MAEELRIRLLGSPAVAWDDRPVRDLEPLQARALLYYLAATGKAHGRDTLAGLLWSDLPGSTAAKHLQDVLSTLQLALGSYLLTSRETVALNPEAPILVDSRQMAGKLAGGGTGPSPGPEEMASLRAAVKLYRGEFLAGFALEGAPRFAAWVRAERERLRCAVEAGLERLVRSYCHQENFQPAADCARQWLALDPQHEAAHRWLMQIYAWDGDRAAALDQYEQCARILDKELGAAPAAETTTLYEQILAGDLQPKAGPAQAPIIRGYEQRERLGEGDCGVVYRAYQPQVGRDVAIKIIRPDCAGRPPFVRGFEAEAQGIARLEHPHIVPLYDYWREPDGAYLVMPWFPAGSLQDSLLQGPWEPAAALRLLEQVAAALAVAHGRGRVHGHIKPANILLDEEGNAHLSDFCLAANATGEACPATSTAYAAPEQVQGKVLGPPADIYSLGVLVYHVLAGTHPTSQASLDILLESHATDRLPPVRTFRPELPPAVDVVLQRAMAQDPAQRFPGALALAHAMHQALDMETTLPQPQPANPYRGLQPFQEADKARFFGREAMIERLLDRLAGERFLAVVGPGGCGTSSLVQAGLVPALRRGVEPELAGCYVTQMRPGAQPFEALALALCRIAVETVPQALFAAIRAGEETLLAAVERALPDDGGELVLVIDPLDELFLLVDKATERQRFLEVLLAAVTSPGSRLRVVVTLRAGRYDRPLQHPGFGQWLQRGTEVVLPLSPSELERAITGPLEHLGLSIEPGLLDQIQSVWVEQPDSLPDLQHTLAELFAQRSGDTLTLETYRAMGGIHGAVEHRAEALYGRLEPAGQQAARRLFLRLAGAGAAAGEIGAAPGLCRRVSQTELLAGADDRAAMETVLESYSRHRLLTLDHDPRTRAPTVEIAHETLLHRWSRWDEWLDAWRRDRRMQRDLAAATTAWLDAGRDEALLLHGTRLVQFEEWAGSREVALAGDEQAYLAASLARRQEAQAQQAARQARERASQRRTVRRLWVLIAVLAMTALAALSLALLAFGQREQAQRQARTATARELAAAAAANLEVDPERSILLALEAAGPALAEDGSVPPEVMDVLHRAVQAARVRYTLPDSGRGAFSPDGRFLVTGDPVASDFEGQLRLWDAASGELVRALSGHTGRVAYVAFSPGGRRVASGSEDGTVRVWDIATGAQLLAIEGHGGGAAIPAFSPDGTRIATAGLDDTLQVWDASTGDRLFSADLEGWGGGLEFSPNGAYIATGQGDGTATIRDAASGEALLTLSGHTDGVCDLAFDPSGSRIATASYDGTAKVWDASTGREQRTLFAHHGFVCGVDWSADGARLATGSEDGTARVWEAATGREELLLAGHSQGIDSVAFRPDGGLLATASVDGTARVWDVSPQGGQEWLTLVAHEAGVAGVTFSPDGSRLVTAGMDGSGKLWDARTGAEIRTLGGSPLSGWPSFHPQGQLLAAGSDDGTAKVWSLDSGAELLALEGHSEAVNATAFSPDGALLATASDDGTAKIWEVAALLAAGVTAGPARATLPGHSDAVMAVAFDPGGTRLATASWDGTARLWDVASGEPVAASLDAPAPLTSLAFSPDGSRLATASTSGMATVWDPATGKALFNLAGHTGIVWDISFSPDAREIATASLDGTAIVWNVDAAAGPSGQEKMTLTGHNGPLTRVAYSPDGQHLATASMDGTVRVYVLGAEELLELARGRVTRSLTTAECREYLHQEACPDRP